MTKQCYLVVVVVEEDFNNWFHAWFRLVIEATSFYRVSHFSLIVRSREMEELLVYCVQIL